MRTLLLAWLLMLPMSVSAVRLGHQAPEAMLSVAAILLLGLGKAWIIVLRFMELNHGPRLWQSLLFGWPLVMTGVILALHATH
ncbi:cytochrome C oxidase subunit IV family protein [Pseudomonas sp. GD04087]|uniref:cytochrome C oxidase subunit IV family protein n=1 Tax=Pseudomonas TaxID=286 RepID=UPI001F17ED52|nr:MULTISPECIES: cytochrome C oxidase subunit IV family protein [Pseudomonas]MDH0288709.1 cytochrome C oxidase subunit IV family protein [Pseudomonas sp. GD04087]MDH1050708.1 cytochrome C oxidase subunit IV family protein [Pseudomonas sp. GD03903]MDH1999115.1 cytochrome C oxidase subunit IV family protein [Pseudomonas sp. GD03691]